jgi:hypothetical protein
VTVEDFDWQAFLHLAEELVDRQGDPAAERTAISRAYDAAFHLASDYARRRGVRLIFTGRDHAIVWAWFPESDADPRLRWIGNTGSVLRQARRHADYRPAPFPNLSSEAQAAVRLATRIRSELARGT